MSFLAAFALENYRVPDPPTIVVATASWAISAALLALCLHTIWEGGGISIREKLDEVRQAVADHLLRLWVFAKVGTRGHKVPEVNPEAEEDGTPAPDEDNIAKPVDIELQTVEGAEY